MTIYDNCLQGLKGNFQKKWVEALRSGRYIQGSDGFLRIGDRFCCMGVALDLIDPSGWRTQTHQGKCGSDWKDCESSYTGQELRKALALNNHIVTSLTILNDVDKMSFEQIAGWIEKNV